VGVTEFRQPEKEDRFMSPCPACGGSSFEILLRPEEIEWEREWLRRFYSRRVVGNDEELKDQVEFTQSEPTFVMGCPRCGTLLRNPQPTPRALTERYAADEYGESTLEQLAQNERSFFESKADWIAPLLPTGARIVEVGSFVGAFLDASRSRGWNAVGIDVGEETSAYCRGLGHEVIQSDLRDAGLADGSFDAVAIWNTFDQVSGPGELLHACRKALKPSGVLVLRLPNGLFETEALRVRTCPRRREEVLLAQAYNNFLTFPYLAGYTPDSITILLRSHGFEVDRLAGDTILPLATDKTLSFAVEEEQRVKRRLMKFMTACEQRTGKRCYPWLDLVARRG
jgi:SAM-dependent methyltransferase